ncbi:nucleotide disphospho-sugar-binding domain-containing protein [Amycolatopsis sp. lyj-112]|uniref:nucleotide disphospho-sugar-binding domain-containing protein n=1 Tax=Amycolatopsis sp. lyj-112 TaxID=2789288 RepID=UPI00397C2B3F
MRVLFTTIPLSGHFFPLVPLAWACRLAGHEVLVATAESFVPTAARSGLPVVACGAAADGLDAVFAQARGHELAERRYAHGQGFASVASQAMPGMAAVVDSWRPDLVVSERAELAGPFAAAERGIPFVELHWAVAELAEYRAAAVDALGTLPVASGVLNPWPPSLRTPYSAGHWSMRNVDYNGDARVPAWALRAAARPRVCVTFGTVLPQLFVDDAFELVGPVLESLARLDVEIVVAVDEKVAAGWPRLPDAVRHVGRLPLSEVLRACDLAVHHGGQGTTLSALGAGLPQVVLPAFDDQFDNGAAVVRAGAGICLPLAALTPTAVGDHCGRLLATPRHAEAATRVADEIFAQRRPADVVTALTRLASALRESTLEEVGQPPL